MGSIVEGMVRHGLGGHGQRRLQTSSGRLQRRGGVERMLSTFLGSEHRASGTRHRSGMAGLLDGVTGRSRRRRGSTGAMAALGAVALSAWREHRSSQTGEEPSEEASADEVDALTGAETETLVLRAMIGAAQADGRIDDAEMENILGRMSEDEVSEADREAAREEARRPVDVDAIGAAVDRPEVATEIYLAALLAIDVDSEAEANYLHRLAAALRLDDGVVRRLHHVTETPEPAAAP
jgi:uncharacterized membrane protein YebE (DUF533 family)